MYSNRYIIAFYSFMSMNLYSILIYRNFIYWVCTYISLSICMERTSRFLPLCFLPLVVDVVVCWTRTNYIHLFALRGRGQKQDNILLPDCLSILCIYFLNMTFSNSYFWSFSFIKKRSCSSNFFSDKKCMRILLFICDDERNDI
jgi:hypothetical protein